MVNYAVYSTHRASNEVTKMFVRGRKNWKWIPVEQYRGGPVALYGLARGLLGVQERAKALGHDIITLDHGYIGARHFDGYYSVTKNARQHTGTGEYDAKRLDPIRPELSPMRHGRHILLLPPSREFARFDPIDVDKWIDTYSKLDTDRRIVVREKPLKGQPRTPIEDDFKDCHAVVTFNSKAAINAVAMGIPAFATHECCVSGISGDLKDIDNPNLDIDRESWLRALSYNQFKLNEMHLWDTEINC